ncbi:MAG TPA: helix-turn-helix transcriptional regulator [Ktedonosporobacter sp.]|nr:helix-turn-helix transcriptional regulator [Ktedonosporobacter sp.]
MKKRAKLVAVRAHKGWTLEQAAEHIGCAPNTLSRWELGIMNPSAYYRMRLCSVYETSADALGLEESEVVAMASRTNDAYDAFIQADLTMRLIAIVYAPQSNRQKLQHALSRTIEEFTVMSTGHEAALTRREALQRLAMFPMLFIAGGSTQRPIEETLHQCAAGITACRYLSKGKYEEMALASSALSSYLPLLKTIIKESSVYRKEAANLAAQVYLLKQVLGLHLESPGVAKNYGKLAVTYSKESGDALLCLTGLRRLTWAYLQEKQPQQALQTIEQAALLIDHTRTPLSPRVSSSIYSTLAVIQVKNGVPAQSALHMAQEAFFTSADADTLNPVDFSYAQLMRNEGLVYYHQGLYKEALDVYAKVIDVNDLTPKVAMPARTHIELLHHQMMAALKSPQRDMEQVTTLWTAEMQGAIDLRSQQRFEDASMAYEVMGGIWPAEPRIQALRELTVHW